MADLKAPFPWFGGKTLAAPLIWRAFGNTPNYVEPFAGSLATLLARPHAPKVETVNDKDGFIANFWRAIKHDPEAVARYCDEPVNEADLHAKHRWLVMKGVPLLERLIDDPEWFDPKIAGWWCWGVCTWIGNGWCHKDERVQKQKRRPELNAANGRGVHAKAKAGPIAVPQYRQLPKVGTPGHGIHAPTIVAPPKGKMPRNARGATGIVAVAPPAGKKPVTHRNKGRRDLRKKIRTVLGAALAHTVRRRYIKSAGCHLLLLTLHRQRGAPKDTSLVEGSRAATLGRGSTLPSKWIP